MTKQKDFNEFLEIWNKFEPLSKKILECLNEWQELEHELAESENEFYARYEVFPQDTAIKELKEGTITKKLIDEKIITEQWWDGDLSKFSKIKKLRGGVK